MDCEGKRGGFRLTTLILFLAVLAALVWQGNIADRDLAPITGVKEFAGLRMDKETLTLPPAADWNFIVYGDVRWGGRVQLGLPLAALPAKPAFLVCMGDMVDMGTPEQLAAYAKLVAPIAKQVPFYHLAGNHDLAPAFLRDYEKPYESIFGRRYYAITRGTWTILFLDTALGWFDHDQRLWIDQQLATLPPKQNLILATHEPPVDPRPTGEHAMLPWGVWQFEDIVAKHPVKLILASHIHDEVTGEWQGIPLWICGEKSVTWRGTEPGYYLQVHVHGENFRVERVAVKTAPAGAPAEPAGPPGKDD